MSGTQTLTNSLFEAAACKCVGYPTRFLVSEQQYAIIDTGDLSDFLLDLREHRQGITDCLGLMETYAELLEQSGQSESSESSESGETTELRPTKITTEAGREFDAGTISDANILTCAGYPLIRTRVEAGKVQFVFGSDDNLLALLKRFNDRKLLIEPHIYSSASRAMWNELKAAHQAARSNGESEYQQPGIASGMSDREAQ